MILCLQKNGFSSENNWVRMVHHEWAFYKKKYGTRFYSLEEFNARKLPNTNKTMDFYQVYTCVSSRRSVRLEPNQCNLSNLQNKSSIKKKSFTCVRHVNHYCQKWNGSYTL